MDSELNSTSTSTQLNTESPQLSTQGNLGSSNGTSSVQPDSTTDLFTSTSGIPLNPTPASTISLNTTSTTTNTPATLKHNFNEGLLVIPLFLIVIAAYTIFQIQRSANNTTE